MSSSLFFFIRHGYLLVFVFSFPSLFLVQLSFSDPRATEAALMCANRTAADPIRQTFITNFLAALNDMNPLIANQGYAAVIKGTGNATVYAFGECMKDLDGRDCNVCFAQCKTQILRCLPFQRAVRGGRLFYDGCYMRYDDYDFFNESSGPQDAAVCAPQNFSGGDLGDYGAGAIALVRNLSELAVANDGFSVGSVERGNVSVFGLAQCWELVNGSDCRSCLADAVSEIGNCTPRVEGRVLKAGCYMRYSNQRFYNISSSPAPSGNGGRSHLGVILASISAAVAAGIIVLAAVLLARRRIRRKQTQRKDLGALLLTVNKSRLNHSYESLEKATNYFHQSNKLGQGGSGSVYKNDGHGEPNVPVSCLPVGSGRNMNAEPLTWQRRFNIILGTAEGLAFLHEESELRIIHRDIKLSNILLDEDFSPKIADFGLARLFPEGQTHISTAVAGTLGYMAPEYVVRGKLTEKADVYSFGIVLIEVVTGRRSNSFSRNPYSIIQTVWNLYESGDLCEAVDPDLQGDFQREEATRLLEIGLLCVQASADLRPSMSVVAKMVVGDHEIPTPTQPPFLNHQHNSSGIGETRKPVRPATASESYSHSSENSTTQSLVEPR
ncbi:unnamed protein product [Linum tenue]|uniref:Cysteine-rich receptor-like protein kinase 3 n=1 Tax=Linum tenue TaxID=586396 RepID=A0AAV0LCE4_9ROSI|nr:unnamed protein product [Linum tenue]